MGRRRAKAKKVVKKAKPVMMTEFKCPFCNHDGSAECKLDYEKESGSLERVPASSSGAAARAAREGESADASCRARRCRVCGADYTATINYLSEPVDVFSEWIDHCEAEEDDDKARQLNEDDDFDDLDDRAKRQRVE